MSDGDASQYGGVGVYDDVILQYRMARNALDGLAVFVQRETLGTEGDTLIQLHVVTDDARLADNHTRAVVDGEETTDFGSRMDVDAISVMMRGMRGTPNFSNSCAMR